MAITTFLTLKQGIENWLGRSDLTNRVPEFIALAEDRIAQDLRITANETQQVLKFTASTDGGTVAGTADAITLTPATAATAYTLADRYSFTAASTNTSTVTVNISGLGAQAIKKRFGGVKEGLAAGDIVAGATYYIYYDGTDFLLAPPGAVPLPTDFVEQRRLYLDVSTNKRLDFFASTVFWDRNAVNESGQPDIYTVEGDYLLVAPVPSSTYYLRLLYYRRFTALSSNTDTNWILTNARGLYLYGALLEAYLFLEDDKGAATYGALYDQQLDILHKATRDGRYPEGALPTRSQVGVF